MRIDPNRRPRCAAVGPIVLAGAADEITGPNHP
jgi:hypothetical protein